MKMNFAASNVQGEEVEWKLSAMSEDIAERLISEYGDSILRMCCLYLKDYHLAEDAAQETFLSAFQNYEKFERKSSERTWITRIAINKCKSIMRKNYFRRERNELLPEMFPSGDEETGKRETPVMDAVMQLPLKEREAILAYYYQELSVKETAGALGISEAAVMQRLKRGRDRLKTILKGLVDDESFKRGT